MISSTPVLVREKTNQKKQMPFNAMRGGLPWLLAILPMAIGNSSHGYWQFFPWLQATYPMLRRGIEPRTQVSKTHVIAISLSERILFACLISRHNRHTCVTRHEDLY